MQFINAYGTHFATKTMMGVKLFSERRYTADEKGDNNDDELKRCNTIMAVKILGFQSDPNQDKCKDAALKFRRTSTSKVKSFILSSYGSYVGNTPNIGEWSRQIQELKNGGHLYPRAIKRELVLIIRFISKHTSYLDLFPFLISMC